MSDWMFRFLIPMVPCQVQVRGKGKALFHLYAEEQLKLAKDDEQIACLQIPTTIASVKLQYESLLDESTGSRNWNIANFGDAQSRIVSAISAFDTAFAKAKSQTAIVEAIVQSIKSSSGNVKRRETNARKRYQSLFTEGGASANLSIVMGEWLKSSWQQESESPEPTWKWKSRVTDGLDSSVTNADAFQRVWTRAKDDASASTENYGAAFFSYLGLQEAVLVGKHTATVNDMLDGDSNHAIDKLAPTDDYSKV